MSDTIPVISIHPNQINLYFERVQEEKRKSYSYLRNQNSEVQAICNSFIKSSRKSNGSLSPTAKRKLVKAVEYLTMMAQPKKVHEKLSGKIVVFKVGFLTLTLPAAQQHKDSEIINSCLNQFLVEVRKYHNVKNYVWRAERQQNGNIHFHIVLDKFVPWWDARNRWNRIVQKLGYVSRFQEKHGHANPNSTDIHSLRKIKNVSRYLTKYLTKNEDQQKDQSKLQVPANDQQIQKDQPNNFQSGRIWGCNQELSNIKGCQLYIDSEVQQELAKIQKAIHPRIFDGSYFQVFNISIRNLYDYSREVLFRYFAEYLIERFNFYPQLKF